MLNKHKLFISLNNGGGYRMKLRIITLNFMILLFAVPGISKTDNSIELTKIEIQDIEKKHLVVRLAKLKWEKAKADYIKICYQYMALRDYRNKSKDPKVIKSTMDFADKKLERYLQRTYIYRDKYNALILKIAKKKLSRSTIISIDKDFHDKYWKNVPQQVAGYYQHWQKLYGKIATRAVKKQQKATTQAKPVKQTEKKKKQLQVPELEKSIQAVKLGRKNGFPKKVKKKNNGLSNRQKIALFNTRMTNNKYFDLSTLQADNIPDLEKQLALLKEKKSDITFNLAVAVSDAINNPKSVEISQKKVDLQSKAENLELAEISILEKIKGLHILNREEKYGPRRDKLIQRGKKISDQLDKTVFKAKKRQQKYADLYKFLNKNSYLFEPQPKQILINHKLAMDSIKLPPYKSNNCEPKKMIKGINMLYAKFIGWRQVVNLNNEQIKKDQQIPDLEKDKFIVPTYPIKKKFTNHELEDIRNNVLRETHCPHCQDTKKDPVM